MKHNQTYYQGFTLVELLTTVIIIAVLTAVGIPMYKHAALKSRFSTVMPVAKAVADAQEVYYLGNGYYAQNDEKEVLDVAATPTEHVTVDVSDKDGYDYVLAQRSDVEGAHYIIYQKHSAQFPGEIHCEANTDEGKWLCEKGLKGTLFTGGSISNGYDTYVLEGSGSGIFAKTCAGEGIQTSACPSGAGTRTREGSCNSSTGEYDYPEQWNEDGCCKLEDKPRNYWTLDFVIDYPECPAKKYYNKSYPNGYGTLSYECENGQWKKVVSDVTCSDTTRACEKVYESNGTTYNCGCYLGANPIDQPCLCSCDK